MDYTGSLTEYTETITDYRETIDHTETITNSTETITGCILTTTQHLIKLTFSSFSSFNLLLIDIFFTCIIFNIGFLIHWIFRRFQKFLM